MLKIGITGQSGFIGTHLFNTLGLWPDDFERILFRDEFFQDEAVLAGFVGQCDTIVHLAAMNRHNDPEVIYQTNIELVQKLIAALDKAGSKPHLLISSSIQEQRDNLYGKSKKEGREMLASWAKKNNAPFSGFVFPNIFGPFSDPYHNSFIATFSHQLNHNETPQIEVDARIPLLYVNEAIKTMMDAIKAKKTDDEILVPHSSEYKVSEILELLKGYKNQYIENGMIPELKNSFEINLFNTFRSYTDLINCNPVKLKSNTDERGSFVETIKTEIGGQFSFSKTRPGITRGNHFHTRKIERFAVIKGKARIQLRRIGSKEVLEFELNGNEPSYVDMPIWYTHNITNTGTEELYTLFWINEFYDPNDPDTYFEKV
jgi:UDP-2-acetamido-2,6-beta-L-arabino-hexul-4-ose reductase